MTTVRYGLRKTRKKLKLTQAQVAKEVDLSRSYYNQIENGTRSPHFTVAQKICQFLNIDIRDWQ